MAIMPTCMVLDRSAFATSPPLLYGMARKFEPVTWLKLSEEHGRAGRGRSVVEAAGVLLRQLDQFGEALDVQRWRDQDARDDEVYVGDWHEVLVRIVADDP